MAFLTNPQLDASGNNNNWTAVNINWTSQSDTTYDMMSDVPTLTDENTGNFCTLNPLSETSNLSTSEANLAVNNTVTESQHRLIRGTMGMSSGKYYWEVNVNNSAYVDMVGIITSSYNGTDNNVVNTSGGFAYGYSTTNGNWYVGGGWTSDGTTPSAFPSSGIIGVAFDADNKKLYFSRNNTWINSANPSAGTGANATYSGSETEFLPALSIYNNTGTWRVNFGQRPFAYTPPTGYKALNTYNLPDSSITDSSQYMDTIIYTGNGSTSRSITGLEFSPDFVWIKHRNHPTAHQHNLFDSVRGATKSLHSNSSEFEETLTNGLTAFNSNGFTVGNNAAMNDNSYNYVAWNWRGSDSTAVSNTDGGVTSTVSANTTSGFSIVTADNLSGTSPIYIGHGLGIAPSVVIGKIRDNTSNWYVQHTSLPTPSNSYLILNSTDAYAVSSNIWDAVPSTTTFRVGNPQNGWNGGSATARDYVFYCFAEVEGFSKFGSYTGNGSTDGPFVYTGFRPSFIILKRTDVGDNWITVDNKRLGYNPDQNYLFPNLSNAEGTADIVDFTSNGFKFRSTSTAVNASGGTYIYMAFAENPFKNSLAR